MWYKSISKLKKIKKKIFCISKCSTNNMITSQILRYVGHKTIQLTHKTVELITSKLPQCDSFREIKRLLKTHLFGDHGTL